MTTARIIDITAKGDVKVKAGIATVIVESNEELNLDENEVGFLEGKRSHHHQGVFMQGGIINPGWKGRLTIEFLVTGEIKIVKGDEVAHATIFRLEDAVETTRGK